MFVGAPQCFGYRPSNLLNNIATTFSSLYYIYSYSLFNLVQVQLIKYHVDLHLANIGIGAVQIMYMKARAHVQPAIVYFGAHTTRGHVEILDVHVWSAYAAIMRRLSTKCFTKLHRGFRILLSLCEEPPPRAQCLAEVRPGGARAASKTAWMRPQVHDR